MKGSWDKSASLIPWQLCLPSREVRSKMLWYKASSQESDNRNTGYDKCSWFCSLGVGNILPEVPGTLTAGKGCRWGSVVSAWEMSEADQPFQGCAEPQIQSTRAESHPASWHPHWLLASLQSASSMQINKTPLLQAGTQEFARFLTHQAWPPRDATLGIPVCSTAKLPSLSDLSYPDSANKPV